MALRLNFKFRTPRKNANGVRQNPQGDRSLYIRLRMNGAVYPQDYSSGVQVPPPEFNKAGEVVKGWDQDAQLVKGREFQALNDRIAAIKDEHLVIMNRQVSLGQIVTPGSVHREWVNGITPPPSLLKAYSAYRDYRAGLTGEEAQKPGTEKAWKYGQRFMTNYLKYRGMRDIELRDVTLTFGKEYHSWLMRTRNQNASTASIYTHHFSRVLDNQVESRNMESNPFGLYKWPKSKRKKVYFLEDHHLAKLAGLQLTKQSSLYRDLCLLMAYTGFDYPDLVRFLQQPDQHITLTKSGTRKISGLRNKTEVNFQVPILTEAEPLIATYRERPLPHHNTVNKHLRTYEGIIGWEGGKVTAKILRKTAGALFLNAGYTIEFVSKLLGHTDTRTTQRYYAHLLDKRVDAEIERIGIDILPKSKGDQIPPTQPA